MTFFNLETGRPVFCEVWDLYELNQALEHAPKGYAIIFNEKGSEETK